jgi:hypothetical protein
MEICGRDGCGVAIGSTSSLVLLESVPTAQRRHLISHQSGCRPMTRGSTKGLQVEGWRRAAWT